MDRVDEREYITHRGGAAGPIVVVEHRFLLDQVCLDLYLMLLA